MHEEHAKQFLELASDQRLYILSTLMTKKTKVSVVARELDATIQQVHKNFERLTSAGLISQDTERFYHLTTFGEMICLQIPSIAFVSENNKYFTEHNFGNIPKKFLMRIGALAGSKYVNGISKVLEQWKTIYKNANENIYTILADVPLDLVEPLIKKVKTGIKFSYILPESVVLPKGMKELVGRLGFRKLVENGLVERKMQKDVNVLVVLNETEACVMFPRTEGEVDMSKMFYSKDPLFHEWCLDYFRYCWYGSDSYQESKLKEE